MKQKHKRPIVKSVKSIQVLTVFMIGAIVVSGLNQKLTFTNLILPLALLIYLVIDIYQSEHHQLIYATEQSRTPPETTVTNTRMQSSADDCNYSSEPKNVHFVSRTVYVR